MSATSTQATGSTKLYEAVYLTVAERLRHVEGRKAMIILSDGADTASKDVSFDEAVSGTDRLTEAVTLFALLELYKAGEASWEQEVPFGPITVRPPA